MKKEKVTGLLLVGASVLILGALYIWAPVCGHGKMIMRCHATGQFETLLALLTLAVGAQMFFYPGKYWIITLTLGVLIVLLTYTTILGPGLCADPAMRCHKTDWWLKIGGLMVIVGGILNAVQSSKK